ncbi:hypothetical protein B566_EDAN015667 [Ephemera danica]|nr:hypothetical protein B566_EDAN015667 [Ephemera danica]
MFKLLFVVALAVVCSQAAPSPGVVSYAAPVVAAPLATSSQVIARNYNGVYAAAPFVAAPAAYAAAPVVAARYAAYNPYAYSAYNPYAAAYVL